MLLPDELQEAVHEGGVHVCLGLLLPPGTVYLICSTIQLDCLFTTTVSFTIRLTADWQRQACKHYYNRGRLSDGWEGMSWGGEEGSGGVSEVRGAKADPREPL